MSAIEYWVMRVVMKVPGGGQLPDDVGRLVVDGHYQVVNGDVCEPIEQHADQEVAYARLLKIAARTGIEHKLVMNADV